MTRACRACGRQITFARGPAGKIVPLERVATIYYLRGVQAVALEGEGELYLSHFATCPQAARFSKRASREGSPGRE